MQHEDRHKGSLTNASQRHGRAAIKAELKRSEDSELQRRPHTAHGNTLIGPHTRR
jgi:hypothetical protein